MVFFHTNLVGWITNRFSKELSDIDCYVHDLVNMFLIPSQMSAVTLGFCAHRFYSLGYSVPSGLIS